MKIKNQMKTVDKKEHFPNPAQARQAPGPQGPGQKSAWQKSFEIVPFVPDGQGTGQGQPTGPMTTVQAQGPRAPGQAQGGAETMSKKHVKKAEEVEKVEAVEKVETVDLQALAQETAQADQAQTEADLNKIADSVEKKLSFKERRAQIKAQKKAELEELAKLEKAEKEAKKAQSKTESAVYTRADSIAQALDELARDGKPSTLKEISAWADKLYVNAKDGNKGNLKMSARALDKIAPALIALGFATSPKSGEILVNPRPTIA